MATSVVSTATAPSLFGTLTHSDGTAFDLTTAVAVRFQMRSSIDRRFSVDAVATIVTPATGAVRYDWLAGDLATPGDFYSRWRIEWNDGSIEYTDPENSLTVGVQ
jgi:hypothetical protein